MSKKCSRLAIVVIVVVVVAVVGVVIFRGDGIRDEGSDFARPVVEREAKPAKVPLSRAVEDVEPAAKGQAEPQASGREESGGMITGLVQTADGKPITGATVRVWFYYSVYRRADRHFGDRGDTAVSGVEGAFVLNGLEEYGYYDLRVTKDGYATATEKRVEVGSDDTVIVLLIESVVSGTVFDEGTGETLAGIKVRLDNTVRDRDYFNPIDTTSDTKGRYSFRGIPASKTYYVDAMGDDVLAEAVGFGIEEGETKDDIDLYMFPSISLPVKAVLKGTNTPVENVTLRAEYWDRKAHFGRKGKGTTGADGLAVISGLRPGRYGISLSGENRYRTEEDRRGQMQSVAVTLVRGKTPETVVIEVIAGRTIRGKIVNEKNEPVDRVDIYPSRKERDRFTHAGFHNIYSDVDGRYEISLPPDESIFKLTFTHSGYARLERIVKFSEDEMEKVVDVVLTKGASVSGHVTDEAGQPIAGAEVMVRVKTDDGGSFGRGRSTNSEGFYKVDGINPGPVTVEAQKEGYAQAILEEFVLKEAGAMDINLVLRRGSFIAGRIMLGEVPLASGEVRFFSKTWHKMAITDNEGGFTIDGLEDGVYDITVSFHYRSSGAEPRYSLDFRDELKGIKTGTEDLVIQVGGLGSIQGTVRDAGDYEPITDFTIRVQKEYDRDRARVRSRRRLWGDPSVSVEDDGSFKVGMIIPGTYKLTAGAEGYAKKVVKDLLVKEDDVIQGVEILLERGGRIKGKVVRADTYEPVQNAGVSAGLIEYEEGGTTKITRSKSAKTDEAGMFETESLKSGEQYQIRVYHHEYPPKIIAEPVTITGLDTIDVGTITLDIGGTVEGKVIDADGKPIRNARLSARWDGGSRATEVDKKGEYELRGVLPGQRIIYCNIFPHDGVGRRRNLFKTAVVPAGETVTVDFALGEGIEVSMVITDNGHPVANSTIELFQVENLRRDLQKTQTDAAGNARFEDVEPGEYLVAIMGIEKGRSYMQPMHYQHKAIINIDAENNVFDIATSNVMFSGWLVRNDGTPAANSMLLFQSLDLGIPVWRERGEPGTIAYFFVGNTDSEGRFSMGRIPPGRYAAGLFVPQDENYIHSRTEILMEAGGSYEDVQLTITE